MNRMLDLIAKGGATIDREIEWKWKQDGEKIMTRSGIFGMIGSGIYAAKKTHDISDLLKETKEDIRRAKENGDRKEIRKARIRSGWAVGKHYILPGAGMIISGMLIDGGMAKAGEKITALGTTATLYATTLRNYRRNVIAEYGEEADRKFMTTEKLPGRIRDVSAADGKRIKPENTEENGEITLPVQPGALKILYGPATTPDIWHDSHALRLATLGAITNELDVMLIANGHLTLNDQRRKFGGPKMDVGIGGVIGRIWDPGNPKNPRGGRRINLHYEEDRDFMEGRKDTVWIIFDVDDEPIINRMDARFTEVEME